MKGAASLGLMIVLFPIPTIGQELVSTLSLTAEAGYLTNTYLHPVLPIWVAADAPFAGLAPSAKFAWRGEKTYANIEGQLRFTGLSDREQIWWLASARSRMHRRIDRSFGIGVDGSVSRIEMDINQWLSWGGAYVAARLGSNVHLTARFGASERRYDAVDTFAATTRLSYFTAAQIGIASSSLWTVLGHVYASHSASDVGDPVGVGSTVRYAWTTGMSTSLELSVERFGPQTSNWQTAASIDWNASSRASWSVRIGTQQLVADGDAAPDVFASLGFTYRLRSRKNLNPPLLRWHQEGNTVTMRYTYRGEGRLYLVGDFNDWRIGETVFRHDEGAVYKARVTLPQGTYEYKIVAVENGTQQWLPLPEGVLTTDDEFGGTNGVLLVE